jgi:hypothetical protein
LGHQEVLPLSQNEDASRSVGTTDLQRYSLESQARNIINLVAASNTVLNYKFAPNSLDSPGRCSLDTFADPRCDSWWEFSSEIFRKRIPSPRPYTPSPAPKSLRKHSSRRLHSKLRYCGQTFSPIYSPYEGCWTDKDYKITGTQPFDDALARPCCTNVFPASQTTTGIISPVSPSYSPKEGCWTDEDYKTTGSQLFEDALVKPCCTNVFPASQTTMGNQPPFKLDPTRMFEMRKAVANAIFSSSRSQSSPDEIMSCGLCIENYQPFEKDTNSISSYFGSNGNAPFAKEKDNLEKLFEKYRGEFYQNAF